MFETIIGRVPIGLILICTIVSSILPLAIYKINQKLHKYGDPPWKKK